MALIWLFSAGVAIVLVHYGFTMLRLSKLRRSRLYPKAGQASMADVERLLKSGSPTWAIRCYREIHGCSLRQAKEAVQNLSGHS